MKYSIIKWTNLHEHESHLIKSKQECGAFKCLALLRVTEPWKLSALSTALAKEWITTAHWPRVVSTFHWPIFGRASCLNWINFSAARAPFRFPLTCNKCPFIYLRRQQAATQKKWNATRDALIDGSPFSALSRVNSLKDCATSVEKLVKG